MSARTRSESEAGGHESRLTGYGSALAAAVIEALAHDPLAVARLRELVGDEANRPEQAAPPAYTVDSLAAAIGVSAKAVRNAIGRGELTAVKRAGRFLIPADAVDAWTHSHRAARFRRAAGRGGSGDGPLGLALARLEAAEGRRRIAAS